MTDFIYVKSLKFQLLGPVGEMSSSRQQRTRSSSTEFRSRDPELRNNSWNEKGSSRHRTVDRYTSEITPNNGKPKSRLPSPKAPRKLKRLEHPNSEDVEAKKHKTDNTKKYEDLKEEESKDLKLELKEKRKELEEKAKDLKEKKKEIARQLIEINTLKKKKEKEGTLEINKNLNKKNTKLQDEKEKLTESIQTLQEKTKSLEEKLKKMEDDNKVLQNNEERLQRKLKNLSRDFEDSNKDLKRV